MKKLRAKGKRYTSIVKVAIAILANLFCKRSVFRDMVVGIQSIRQLIEKRRQKRQIMPLESTLIKLSEKGYQLNDLQRNFLKAYDGIEIGFNSPRAQGYREKLVINASKVAGTVLRYMVEEYEEHTEKKLLIVGEIPEEDMSIYISEDGFFYGCNGDILIDFGDSFERFVYIIINGVEMKLEILD
ncbi:SUKH-3 domain-containing protein [Vagococcus sp. BWB3-3]|uniref:SUKH-3 domain-containing protein n=1 Tax=Vagococcus allomyrinae TaxID=2794353 RepID=A0A940SXV9_9ENTE|nr:SUKH-3 domain-containing protein [Vagococcus allomyrinae]MBP1044534.1 SUKH-3 domain-containing protein [Vagococcus allomyrinae]